MSDIRYESVLTRLVPVLFLVLGIFFIAWRHYHPVQPPYMQGNTLKILVAIQYWKTDIARVGPEQAHTDMVQQGYAIAPASRHALAHTFGEALYDAGGLPYLIYCGPGEFLYGCYHQFIGLATAQFGISIINQLKGICETSESSAGSCAHGIGHGLVSTYGYERKDLDLSLSKCAFLYPQEQTRGDCADGVFMEYNLQEITTLDQDRIPRTFSPSGAYEPCLSLGTGFQSPCVYELPLWWSFALFASSTDANAVFKTMGNLCRSMPSQDLIPVCFDGIGFPAAQENFNAAHIIKACSASSISENENVSCLSGAARRFYENGLPYQQTCGNLGLTGADELYCEKFVSQSRDVEFTMQAP